MQSQPERLVMENLCTSSPLLPPHLINNTLIYYLHFQGISPRKFEAGREREINCPPPLSVFNYNVCNGSSICQLGTPQYLCHCNEMKPCCLEKIKQYFSVHGCPLQMQKQTIQSGGFAWHLRIKKIIFPALTSGAFSTNPGKKKSIVSQANWNHEPFVRAD